MRTDDRGDDGGTPGRSAHRQDRVRTGEEGALMRKRKAVKSKDKLASALAMLLPQSERDRMRRGQLRAEYSLSLFEFHHIVFHAHGGSDDWWNLHPMEKDEHRARSKGLRSDTSVVAKVKRVRQPSQAVSGK